MAGKSRPQEEVIKEFIEVHGNKYDYSKVIYTGASKNIIIICPIHGDFKLMAGKHKCGRGCKDCRKIKEKEERLSKAKQYVIAKFRRVHGDFPQTPNRHKLGKGCPDCGRENNTPTWGYTEWQKAGEKSKNFDNFKVYILRCWNEDEEFYKIGKTFKKVKDRFNSKYHMPYNYETVLEETFENAKEASIREDDLKAKNRENKYLPSINFNGKQECFSKNPCTD